MAYPLQSPNIKSFLMKKVSILISFLIALTCAAKAEKYVFNTDTAPVVPYTLDIDDSVNGEITIKFKLNEIEFENDIDDQLLFHPIIHGFGLTCENGIPSLPIKSFFEYIPTSQKVEISVSDLQYCEYNKNISPARSHMIGNSAKSEMSPIIPYSGYYFNEVITEDEIQYYRKAPRHYFKIHPVDYNFDTKTVRVYTAFTAKLTYTKSEISRKSSDGSTLIGPIGDVTEYKSSVDVTEDYLLLATMTAQHDTTLNKFADWKRQ